MTCSLRFNVLPILDRFFTENWRLLFREFRYKSINQDLKFTFFWEFDKGKHNLHDLVSNYTVIYGHRSITEVLFLVVPLQVEIVSSSVWYQFRVEDWHKDTTRFLPKQTKQNGDGTVKFPEIPKFQIPRRTPTPPSVGSRTRRPRRWTRGRVGPLPSYILT